MKQLLLICLMALLVVGCGGGGGGNKSMPTVPEPMPEMPMPDQDKEEPKEEMPKADDGMAMPDPEKDMEETEDEMVMPKDMEEEETEDEMVMPEDDNMNPELMGFWKDRYEYDTTAMVPAPMMDGAALAVTGTAPNFGGQYSGPITGTISENRDDLTNPRVAMQVHIPSDTTKSGSINMQVLWDRNGTPMDAPLTRYGARLESDGTFNSFPQFDETRKDNPTGFNGAFYGAGHDVVAGHVVTPRVYGTYKAELE